MAAIQSFRSRNRYGGIMNPIPAKYENIMKNGISKETPLTALPGIEDQNEKKLLKKRINTAFQLLRAFQKLNDPPQFLQQLIDIIGFNDEQARDCAYTLYDYDQKLQREQRTSDAQADDESYLTTITLVLGAVALGFVALISGR